MAQKLSSRQVAQLEYLQTLPQRFQRIHAVIEEMSALRADDVVVRGLIRLLDEIKDLTGKGNVSADYQDPRAGDVVHSLADISRARELLNFEPRVGLREGLKLTIDWWKQSRFATS